MRVVPITWGWGVDTDLFQPADTEPEYTFFHNAGWLGINFRKMTPAVIVAFDAISKLMPDISLFIHSQAGLDLFPPAVTDIVTNNRKIVYHVETVPAPGSLPEGQDHGLSHETRRARPASVRGGWPAACPSSPRMHRP